MRTFFRAIFSSQKSFEYHKKNKGKISSCYRKRCRCLHFGLISDLTRVIKVNNTFYCDRLSLGKWCISAPRDLISSSHPCTHTVQVYSVFHRCGNSPLGSLQWKNWPWSYILKAAEAVLFIQFISIWVEQYFPQVMDFFLEWHYSCDILNILFSHLPLLFLLPSCNHYIFCCFSCTMSV